MIVSNEPKPDAKLKEETPGESTTVRGSGFTYDEDQHRTDESVPKEKSDPDPIIELPDLGDPGTM
jgi:hypothetical protein